MNNKLVTILTHKPLQRLAHNPRTTKVLACSLMLAPVAISAGKDIFEKESVQEQRLLRPQLVPANTELFTWAKPQPKLSMTEINPESMVWVHMTEYFPQNGRILSSRLATRDENGAGAGFSTIHGAINKSVTEHLVGKDWQTMSYAVIAPFSKLLENIPSSRILGGIQDDFFFQDNIDLPEGSIILKYNPEIEKGCLAVTEFKKGVRLVESSDKNMGEVANTVIKKMGFEVYNDALINYLDPNEREKDVMFSMPESELLGIFNTIESLGGVEKYREIILENIRGLKEFVGVIPEKELTSSRANYERNLIICDLKEKYQDKMHDFPNAFDAFCKNNGYHSGLHHNSSWAKCDFALLCTDVLVKQNDNSWGKKEYKEAVLNAIKVAKEIIPSGKSLGFDADKMYEIISKSETPKMALENIEKELKIKPLPNARTKVQEEIPDYAKEFVIDILFATFGLM